MSTDLERLNIILAARDREFARAMETNQRRVERFAKQSQRNLSNTSKGFDAMGQAAKLAAPLIAAIGARAMVGRVESTIAALDDIGKTADRIGLTTSALQELRTVAESAGIAQTSLDSSLERFSKRIGEAVQGTGAAKKALEEMGLSARSLADMGLDQAVSLIADEMAEISDPTERAARAAALFGREGVAMVNLLREGSAGMERMRAEARELGIVIDESVIRGAEDAQTKLDLMSRVIDAQLSTALINLAPLLVGAAQNIATVTRAVNEFLNINWDLPEMMDAGQLRELADGYAGAQAELAAMTQAEAAYRANLEQYGPGSDQAVQWAERLAAARANLTTAINRQKRAEAALQDGVGAISEMAAARDAAREKARLAEMGADAAERERIAKEKAAYIDRIVQGLDRGGDPITDEQLAQVLRLADEFEAAEIAASKVINPAREIGAAAGGSAAEVEKVPEAFRRAQAEAEGLRSSVARTFGDIITGAESASDAVSGLLSNLAGMFANAAFGGLFKDVGIFDEVGKLLSFDGGGRTPSGPRSGGLDGKGGFMAMLHPNESVIDHTKGQSAPAQGGGGLAISIQVNGARGNAEITDMVERGVRQGLQEYDRSVLPRSVAQINRDPRRIG